jgi:hypothetical protein
MNHCFTLFTLSFDLRQLDSKLVMSSLLKLLTSCMLLSALLNISELLSTL